MTLNHLEFGFTVLRALCRVAHSHIIEDPTGNFWSHSLRNSTIQMHTNWNQNPVLILISKTVNSIPWANECHTLGSGIVKFITTNKHAFILGEKNTNRDTRLIIPE